MSDYFMTLSVPPEKPTPLEKPPQSVSPQVDANVNDTITSGLNKCGMRSGGVNNLVSLLNARSLKLNDSTHPSSRDRTGLDIRQLVKKNLAPCNNIDTVQDLLKSLKVKPGVRLEVIQLAESLLNKGNIHDFLRFSQQNIATNPRLQSSEGVLLKRDRDNPPIVNFGPIDNHQSKKGSRDVLAYFGGIGTGLKSDGKHTGVLYNKGENTAVDLLPYEEKRNNETGKMELGFYGIVRGDSGQVATMGGFKEGDQTSEAQAKEFFEEMLSGSAPDLGEKAQTAIKNIVDTKVSEHEERENGINGKGVKVTAFHRSMYTKQAEAELKLVQINKSHPFFLRDLTQYIKDNSEVCFTGPMIRDSRNTDDSIVTTTASIMRFSQELMGILTKAGLSLKPGDDALKVNFQIMGANFHDDSFASHSNLQSSAAARYLATKLKNDEPIPDSILKQLQDLDHHIDTKIIEGTRESEAEYTKKTDKSRVDEIVHKLNLGVLDCIVGPKTAKGLKV
jgi:hypothetical protein